MKRDFSFYEFVGILIPGTVILYSLYLLLKLKGINVAVDISNFGESIIFLVLAYGIGHLMHAFGNFFEALIWTIFNGWPTNWITKKPRFSQYLFKDPNDEEKVREKLKHIFGESENKDYGRLAYSYLFNKKLTERVDIFSGNYSLFRGLSISFLILSILLCLYFNLASALISFVFFILSLYRMIRFGKYYAKEIYHVFLTCDDNLN